MNALSFIIEAIKHTPQWVFAVFFYLLWIGIKATYNRTVFVPSLLIMPLVFLGMKARTLMNADGLAVTCYLGALLAGALAGYLFAHRVKIGINKAQKTIDLPGSYHTLIIVLTLFSIKYTFGYLHSQHPTLANDYALLENLISGVFVGFSVGRVTSYIARFMQA